MRELSAACTELADQLAVFYDNDVTSDRADAGLLTSTLLVVDQDAEPGTGRRTVPATRTPGNTQAINAEMDAHALVRRLEASLRLVVTGHTGRMRGGSDSSTRAAIASIEKLGEAVSPAARQLAARLLDRATTTIGQLPSVDEIPRWEKIRPGPGGLPPTCPNCETYSLRVALSAGVVVCVFPGCKDMDGRRPPQARMDLSKIDGRPVLVWRDGLVQLLTRAARVTQPPPPLPGEDREPLPAFFTVSCVRHRSGFSIQGLEGERRESDNLPGFQDTDVAAHRDHRVCAVRVEQDQTPVFREYRKVSSDQLPDLSEVTAGPLHCQYGERPGCVLLYGH